MEIAIKVENQDELELFNKMYGQEAVKAPALYVYVNGIYMENNIEDQNFLEAIGYRIIGVR